MAGLTNPLPIRVHGATHEGLVHDKNEDSFDVVTTEEGGLLLIVCDGMGGMGHGDEASQLAVKGLADFMEKGVGFPPERLRQAIKRADVLVREELCNGNIGLPGSTAVMVYVLDGVGHVAWVGDSRAYLIRNGHTVERTRDHKLVDELVAAGQLSAEEARSSSLAHVVTRALGGRPTKEKPVSGSTLGHPWKFRHGDTVVICSDGVCDLITDDELPGVITDATPEEAARNIVQLALERGGHDNITVIVGIWEGEDYSEEEAATPMFHSREIHPDADVRGPDFVPQPSDDFADTARVTEELDPNEIPAEPEDSKETPVMHRRDIDPDNEDTGEQDPAPSAFHADLAEPEAEPEAAPSPPAAAAPERPAWLVPVSIVVFLIIVVGLALRFL